MPMKLTFPGTSLSAQGAISNQLSSIFVLPPSGSITVVLTQALNDGGNIGALNVDVGGFDANENKWQDNPVAGVPYTFTFNASGSRNMVIYSWLNGGNYRTGLTGAGWRSDIAGRDVYQAAVLADSPISYWRLGEQTGTSAADVMGVNAGTYHGTYTLGQTARIGDGNTAVALGGSISDYVDAASSASLIRNNGAVSVEAWVKRTSTSAHQAIVSKGRSAYYLRWRDDNKLNFLRSQQADLVSATVAHNDTNWHHVVGTYAGSNGNIKLYVDAVDETGAQGPTPNLSDEAWTLSMGVDSTGVGFSEPLPGTIDEVAVYSTELSAARILAHYSAGLALQRLALGGL